MYDMLIGESSDKGDRTRRLTEKRGKGLDVTRPGR
jgi:hypothetical protein